MVGMIGGLISLAFFVLNIVDIKLLRNWERKRATFT